MIKSVFSRIAESFNARLLRFFSIFSQKRYAWKVVIFSASISVSDGGPYSLPVQKAQVSDKSINTETDCTFPCNYAASYTEKVTSNYCPRLSRVWASSRKGVLRVFSTGMASNAV